MLSIKLSAPDAHQKGKGRTRQARAAVGRPCHSRLAPPPRAPGAGAGSARPRHLPVRRGRRECAFARALDEFNRPRARSPRTAGAITTAHKNRSCELAGLASPDALHIGRRLAQPSRTHKHQATGRKGRCLHHPTTDSDAPRALATLAASPRLPTAPGSFELRPCRPSRAKYSAWGRTRYSTGGTCGDSGS